MGAEKWFCHYQCLCDRFLIVPLKLQHIGKACGGIMRGCCDSEALGWKNAILGTPGCWHRGSLQSSGCGVLLGLEAGCRGRAGGDQLAEGLLG